MRSENDDWTQCETTAGKTLRDSCSRAVSELSIDFSELRKWEVDVTVESSQERQDNKQDTSVMSGHFEYECPDCGAAFAQASKLKIHRRTHAGANNLFKCEICSAAFSRACKLKTHLQIHTYNASAGNGLSGDNLEAVNVSQIHRSEIVMNLVQGHSAGFAESDPFFEAEGTQTVNDTASNTSDYVEQPFDENTNMVFPMTAEENSNSKSHLKCNVGIPSMESTSDVQNFDENES